MKTISSQKKKLWKVFSKYIRLRDKGICFTCGRYAEGSGYHAGHFVSKSVGGLTLYFHEENVRGQCYNCNINLSGNQYEFSVRLGEETTKKLLKLKQEFMKLSISDYDKLIEKYEEKVRQLEN